MQSSNASGQHFLLHLLSAVKTSEAEYISLEQEQSSPQAVQISIFWPQEKKYLKCRHVAVMPSGNTSYPSFSPLLLEIVLSSQGGRGRMTASASTAKHGHWALYSGLGVVLMSGLWPAGEESPCFFLYRLWCDLSSSPALLDTYLLCPRVACNGYSMSAVLVDTSSPLGETVELLLYLPFMYQRFLLVSPCQCIIWL